MDPRGDQLRRAGQDATRSSRRRSPPASSSTSSRRARCELLARHRRQTAACAARVAVRVNPDFELKSSGMKMGGGPKQFGVDAERVPDAARARSAGCGLAFEGFHIFSGSQNLSAEAICEAQRKIVRARAASSRRTRRRRCACSTSAAASAFRIFPASSRSTSRRSAQPRSARRRGRATELPQARARDRTRPLPRRRGRHLRLPRRRPQDLARPGVPRHRRRPASSPRGVRQLRPGDPQELSGRDRQPRARRARARSRPSSVRCARRSTCSPTGWSSPRRTRATWSSCSSPAPTG